MQRYGDVAHIPASARVAAGVRQQARAAISTVRQLVPGSSAGHMLRWEDRRGWVIRPKSGIRTLSWTSPVAATTAISRDDSDAAAGWSAEVLGIA